MPRDPIGKLYIGNLSSRTTERDLESEFSHFGPIANLTYKQTFAFVEFEDVRDADDAIRDMNGQNFDGSKLIVQFAKGPRDGAKAGKGGGGGRGGGFRVRVEGLDDRVSWQDLKDFARSAGDVAFTNIWTESGRAVGVIEYTRSSDRDEALDTLDGKIIDKHGCTVKLILDKSNEKRLSLSRSPRRGGSYSPDRRSGRSPPPRRRSPPRRPSGKDSRSKSRSRSGGRQKTKGKKSRSDSRDRKTDKRKRSVSPHESKKKEKSRRSRSYSRSRSRSRNR